jgi:hypothetical protein
MAEGYTAQPPSGIYAGLRAVTSQTYIEANVKLGKQFEASVYNPTLSGTTQIIIKTGALPLSIKAAAYRFDGDGVSVKTSLVTSFTGGTLVPIYNRNFKNPVAPLTEIYILPATIVVGAQQSTEKTFLGSTSVGGSVISTSDVEAEGLETILDRNSMYVTEITSLDASPQRFSSYATWYEGELDLPRP